MPRGLPTPGRPLDPPLELSLRDTVRINKILFEQCHVPAHYTRSEMQGLAAMHHLPVSDDVRVPASFTRRCTTKAETDHHKAHAILQYLHVQRYDRHGTMTITRKQAPTDARLPGGGLTQALRQDAWATTPTARLRRHTRFHTATHTAGSLTELLGDDVARCINSCTETTAALLSGGCHASNATCAMLGIRGPLQSHRNYLQRADCPGGTPYARYVGITHGMQLRLHTVLITGCLTHCDDTAEACNAMSDTLRSWYMAAAASRLTSTRSRRTNRATWAARRALAYSICQLLGETILLHTSVYTNSSLAVRTAMLATRWQAAAILICTSRTPFLRKYANCLTNPFSPRPTLCNETNGLAPMIYLIVNLNSARYYVG